MPISDLTILSSLRTRMQWHQERQRVLSENVANADTPGFRPRDLAPPDVSRSAPTATAATSLARTDAGHIGGSAATAGTRFDGARGGKYEVRPAGNAVNLEDEMLKVAENNMDYQAATALYTRSLGLLKTALGKR